MLYMSGPAIESYSIINIIIIFFRNPKPSERPSFSCLAANLSIPDYIILQKDDAVSEEGMIIGSPLSFGSKLYNDLQMKFINM